METEKSRLTKMSFSLHRQTKNKKYNFSTKLFNFLSVCKIAVDN